MYEYIPCRMKALIVWIWIYIIYASLQFGKYWLISLSSTSISLLENLHITFFFEVPA